MENRVQASSNDALIQSNERFNFRISLLTKASNCHDFYDIRKSPRRIELCNWLEVMLSAGERKENTEMI